MAPKVCQRKIKIKAKTSVCKCPNACESGYCGNHCQNPDCTTHNPDPYRR